MMRLTPRRALFAATTLLAGCAGMGQQAASGGFPAPQPNDGGIVIAESHMVMGASDATTVTGTVDDCSGPGTGVVVTSTLHDARFLFGPNGEPCEAAEMLFDGRTEANRRQADPAIALTFHDSLGPKPESRTTSSLPGLEPIPTIRLKSEILSTMAAIEPAAGKGGTVPARPAPVQVAAVKADPLVSTLTSWQRQDDAYARRSAQANANAEATAAASRDLSHIVKDTRTTTSAEAMATMMAELRERERQVQEEQRRHAETLKRAQENRQITAAARTQWQSKEHELQAQLSATQQRMAQFEQLAQRLSADKSAKEQAYQAKISTLTADLRAAEAQADVSRRELILEAAAKIAEAEQLASAAKIQEQQIKLREAARLKAEAETMMDRALAMQAGGNVVVAGVGAPPAVPLALLRTPVAVVANGKSLPDILTDVLKQAAPQAGEWQADWQLSVPRQHILQDTWSLTAEAPIEEVLAQLSQQVQAAHGFGLTFTQFAQSRLLVVTDATPPTAQTTP